VPATTNLITIEEFDKLDLPHDRKWELHGGEVVELAFSSLTHHRLQLQLVEILKPLFPAAEVLPEYPFQVAATRDMRSADVAVVDGVRARSAPPDGILSGTPEMVIEILSPSNSYPEMKRYRRLCFENDTLIFLILDPDDNTVEVYAKGRKQAEVYGPGEAVPVSLLGVETTLMVSQIFAGITLS